MPLGVRGNSARYDFMDRQLNLAHLNYSINQTAMNNPGLEISCQDAHVHMELVSQLADDTPAEWSFAGQQI
jgi:hypothetical protein